MLLREFFNLNEASYDSMIAALMKKYPDDQWWISEELAWAKSVLQRSDRVVWYMRLVKSYLEKGAIDPKLMGTGTYRFSTFEMLREELGHYFGVNIPKIQNFAFTNQTVNQIMSEFGRYEREFQALQKKSQGVPVQEGDRPLIEFKDGYKWWWVDRAYCEKEGQSGGHCGNVTGKYKQDQRILSFRTPQGQVLLTFILEPNGYLGEMKAKNNQRPQPKFHPYIVELLKLDIVKGIQGGGYAPHMNFSMFDLDAKYIEYFLTAKPLLLYTQLEQNPTEILRAPKIVQQDPEMLSAVSSSPGVITLLNSKQTTKDWQRAVQDQSELIIYAPHDMPGFESLLMSYFADFGEDSGASQAVMSSPPSISKNPELLKKIVEVSPGAILGISPNVKNYEELAKLGVRSSSVRNILEMNLEDKPEALVKAYNAYFDAESDFRDYYDYSGDDEPNKKIENLLINILSPQDCARYIRLIPLSKTKEIDKRVLFKSLEKDDRMVIYIDRFDLTPEEKDHAYLTALKYGDYTVNYYDRLSGRHKMLNYTYDLTPRAQQYVLEKYGPNFVKIFKNPDDRVVLDALETSNDTNIVTRLTHNSDYIPSKEVMKKVDSIIRDLFFHDDEAYQAGVKHFKDNCLSVVKRLKREAESTLDSIRGSRKDIKDLVAKIKDREADAEEVKSTTALSDKTKEKLLPTIKNDIDYLTRMLADESENLKSDMASFRRQRDNIRSTIAKIKQTFGTDKK